MATEMTDREKLRKLAGWSRRYRAGVQEMVEAGHDPDQLDADVEEMEAALEQEDKARAKRQATRRAIQKW